MVALAVTLLLLLILLQAGDAYTTFRILANGGKEENPIITGLGKLVGGVRTALVIEKVLVSVMAVVVVLKDTAAYSASFLAVACAGYIYVVAHNVRVMRSQ